MSSTWPGIEGTRKRWSSISGTTVVPFWVEVPSVKKSKADIVQSTLRLPRALWVRINHIAAYKNLSMQQAVQEAIFEYCTRESKKGGK